MDYLACNLPAEAMEDLEAHWVEYWHGETLEAKLSRQICMFEHMVALKEDGIPCGDSNQSLISSPDLQGWMTFMDTSEDEILALLNGASIGPSYWNDPEENKRLLAETIFRDKSPSSPLPYIRMLRRMSKIKRRGWIKRGMEPSGVESNASHSWGVALICLLFSPKVCVVLCVFYDSLI